MSVISVSEHCVAGSEEAVLRTVLNFAAFNPHANLSMVCVMVT
jgi:hypothetical protein